MIEARSLSTVLLGGLAAMVLVGGIGGIASAQGHLSLTCVDGDTGAVYETDAGLRVSDDASPVALTSNPVVNDTTLQFANVTIRASGQATMVLETALADRLCVGQVDATATPITLAPDRFGSVTVDGKVDGLTYGQLSYSAGSTDLVYNSSASVSLRFANAPSAGTAVAAVDVNSGATLTTGTVSGNGTLSLSLPVGTHHVDLQPAGGPTKNDFSLTVVPSSVTVNSPTQVTVTATNDDTGAGVQGAIVSLSGAGVTASATTNSSGVATFMINASSTGTISVTVDKSGYNQATASISVMSGQGPIVIGNTPAKNVDADPQLEDVDGTNDLTIVDVQALFANLQSTAVQTNPTLFDFGGGSGVGIVDVQALFVDLQSS